LASEPVETNAAAPVPDKSKEAVPKTEVLEQPQIFQKKLLTQFPGHGIMT
jgi:hypothetical protein